MDLRESLFMGNTLRGLLLYGYAFATIGTIADMANLSFQFVVMSVTGLFIGWSINNGIPKAVAVFSPEMAAREPENPEPEPGRATPLQRGPLRAS